MTDRERRHADAQELWQMVGARVEDMDKLIDYSFGQVPEQNATERSTTLYYLPSIIEMAIADLMDLKDLIVGERDIWEEER